MNAKSLTEILAIQTGYSHWVTLASLKDVPDDAYFQSPAGGGNCLNWVLGHLVQSRNGWLTLVGQDPIMDAAIIDRYKRSSDAVTGPECTVAPADLRDAFKRSQEPLHAGLANLADDVLTQKAPFSPGNDENETMGSLLAGMAFHEAYHAGQIGVIRRTLGFGGIVK